MAAKIIPIPSPRKVVSQESLERVLAAQQAAWLAQRKTYKYLEALRALIEAGIEVEDGPVYFDAELGMVREVR